MYLLFIWKSIRGNFESSRSFNYCLKKKLIKNVFQIHLINEDIKHEKDKMWKRKGKTLQMIWLTKQVNKTGSNDNGFQKFNLK